jgi:hypothetical protein
VARTILKDFEAHQDEMLPRLRRWFVPQYLQLIGRLLPKNGSEGPDDAATLAEALAEALAAAEAAAEDGEG